MLCHAPCRYKAETAAGASEVKDHVLDDATDDLWAELRHAHIAGVMMVWTLRETGSCKDAAMELHLPHGQG